MNYLPFAATIADYLHDSLGLTNGLAMMLAAIIHGSLLVAIFMGTPVVWIWGERKIAGRIQDRLGPTRVGGRFGWLQSVADGIKLIQKEDLVPPAADSMLYRMAPYMVCIAAFATLMVLPFGDTWVAVASDIGLYVLVAVLSLEVIGIILAGYSSGSKWSLFGGMREAAQMVSYEIPLSICAIIPITAAGSLNLAEIAQMQSGWANNWLIFHDPFVLVTFFIYFTVATAGCKRAPFDLAEAESELVGGFHTEYSGMRWSFFFMGEYAAMFVVCAVASILFLGGWNSGLEPLDNALLQMRALSADGSFQPMSYLANAIGMGILISKAWVLVFVQVWIRWTLPRLRIDQVMITCLKYLIPMSCALFLGTICFPLIMFTATAEWAPIMDGDEPVMMDADGRRVVMNENEEAVVTNEDGEEVIIDLEDVYVPYQLIESKTSLWAPKAEKLVKPTVSEEGTETSQLTEPKSDDHETTQIDRKVAGGAR